MSSDKSDLIKKLCDAWTQNSIKQEGGFVVDAQTEKCRLRNNGIVFPELNFNEIRAACIGLTNVLIHNGLNTIIDRDHYLLWAWLAELIMQDRTYFPYEEHEIKELFDCTFRIALSQRANNSDFQTNYIITQKHLVLTHLSMPLLEGLLKKLCKNFVTYNGRVIKEFKISEKNKIDKFKNYAVGKQCSSIRALLHLHYDNISNPEFKNDLTNIKEKISRLDNCKDGFDIIGEWRNSSLHGEMSISSIGGTIICLITLLILHSLDDRYEILRQKALVSSEMYSPRQIGQRPPWSFYPPF